MMTLKWTISFEFTAVSAIFYTHCACCTTHQILFIKIAKKPLQSIVFINFNHARKKGLSGKDVHQFSVKWTCPKAQFLQAFKRGVGPTFSLSKDKRILWRERAKEYWPCCILQAVFNRLFRESYQRPSTDRPLQYKIGYALLSGIRYRWVPTLAQHLEPNPPTLSWIAIRASI